MNAQIFQMRDTELEALVDALESARGARKA
jgi:hypothetical protein